MDKTFERFMEQYYRHPIVYSHYNLYLQGKLQLTEMLMKCVVVLVETNDEQAKLLEDTLNNRITIPSILIKK